jgi:hypothetical protein
LLARSHLLTRRGPSLAPPPQFNSYLGGTALGGERGKEAP